ncbi:MAG: hypothetical protein ABIW76_20740 [Fibrobacteria bacterium]
METVQIAALAFSALSAGLCLYVLMKIKTITYLLEQPVVKKMSPQLNLKPVKVDGAEGDSRSTPSRNNAPASSAPGRGPRPETTGGERPPRDANRDRGPRPERAEGGERPPREGGFERNGADRGPRPERGGDRFPRDRGDRGERGGRGGPERHERSDRGDRFGGREGGDRNRTRSESPVGEAPVQAPSDSTPRNSPLASEAPAQHTPPAALAPRRPLPSTVAHEVEAKDFPSHDPLAANAAADDAMFNRDDSDMTHGRRHAQKKKPRFEVNEPEAKTEETKA